MSLDLSGFDEFEKKYLASVSDEEFDVQCARRQAEFDDEWCRWLSQYDDNGEPKPGLRGTCDYIHNRSISFLRMSDDEKRAYILSEKKRMGLL